MPERALGQIRVAQQAGDRVALQRAHAALVAGCGYLIARATGPSIAMQIMPNVRLRRSGNCLNELDRFLAVLIGECARAVGIVEIGISAEGADSMPRRMDTARRLRRLETHCGVVSSATTRLRAIARIRNLACGDGLQRPGAWLERDMAVATAGAVAIIAHPTKTPEISDQALAAVAEFYLAIAGQLHASFAEI